MRLYEGLMGPMTVFMMRIVGGGLLMMTLVAYSLKDGADRQKLGALTFRCGQSRAVMSPPSSPSTNCILTASDDVTAQQLYMLMLFGMSFKHTR